MHCIIISKFHDRQKLYMYEFKFVLIWYISKETKKLLSMQVQQLEIENFVTGDESNIDNIHANGLI